MRAVSIDPGLDVTGLAAWHWRDPARTPSSLNVALSALQEATEIRTSPRDELPVRLASLAIQTRSFLEAWHPTIVWVEVPSFHGNYAKNPGRRKSVNKLYQAIGAILARTAPDGRRVVCVPASREKKARRLQLLEHAARMADVTLPPGEDARDAVWLGAAQLIAGDWRSAAPGTRASS